MTEQPWELEARWELVTLDIAGGYGCHLDELYRTDELRSAANTSAIITNMRLAARRRELLLRLAAQIGDANERTAAAALARHQRTQTINVL